MGGWCQGHPDHFGPDLRVSEADCAAELFRGLSEADRKEGEVVYMGILATCVFFLVCCLEEYTNTKAMESRLKSFQYSLKKNFRPEMREMEHA